jgi:epoxyqueuosine reductase
MYGEMNYMARNYEKRVDPVLLVENTKSIISLAVNYFPEEQQNPGLPQIAKYAYGTDYHMVVKDMLYQLLDVIKTQYGNVSGRVFTDSAPVLEHAWAERSGLGWIGKHSLIIHPQHGSFLFLGELFIDMEIEPDAPVADRCGSCTRCMDACPVKAIIAPRIVDARRCLSYLTIEYRGTFDPEVQLHGRLFGCDICQDVCPWNKKAGPGGTNVFKSDRKMLDKTVEEWQHLSEEEFDILTANSPLQRAGFHAIKRNAKQLGHNK